MSVGSVPVPSGPGEPDPAVAVSTGASGGSVVNNFPSVQGNPTVHNWILSASTAPSALHQIPPVQGCLHERTEKLDELN